MMSNVRKILEFLATRERNEIGEAWTTGNEIREETGIIPADINDAIEIAENREFVEVLKTLGTAPFKFHSVTITAEGRFSLEKQ